MPLGVGKRMQKDWGRLVGCRPSNEDISLRPRGSAWFLCLFVDVLYHDSTKGTAHQI
jgi:hypothetical protein